VTTPAPSTPGDHPLAEALAALRESETRFRTIFDMVNEAIFIHDPADGSLWDVNQTTCEMFGYTKAEILRRTVQDLSAGIPPFTQAEARAWLERARWAPVPPFEWLARDKKGRTFWIEVHLRPIQLNGQERILATARDIQERKRAERDRQLNEQRLGALLRLNEMVDEPLSAIADFALEEAVKLTGSRIGYLAFLNEDESVLRMFSWSRDAMAECQVTDKPLLYRVAETGLWGEAVRQRRAIVTNDYSAPNPLKKGTPPGHVHLCRHMNVPVFDRNKIVLIAGVGNKEEPYEETDMRQLTLMMQELWVLFQRKRAEEERQRLARQMQEAQKLESLGVLAGGVAHEFNNLLMTILGHADLALQDLPDSSSSRESVVEIETAARMAASLSRQMLAYSGRGSFVVEKFDLRELLREMKPLLEASVSKKTVLQTPLNTEPIWVNIDPAQMRQVIANLILNAAEAIGDKDGLVTVSTGVTQCSREFFSQTYLPDELPAGIYTVLEVADTGCGIPKQNLNRIFDPFFSTKFTGRGLGLPVVLGIIRGHKGAIQVESAVGKGTTFRIWLPVAVDPAEAASHSPAQTTTDTPSTGTILLVDDEPAIRTLGRKMLGRLGYKSLLAANGREAIEIYRERRAEIDGIVLDLTMPHMGGEEAFEELRRLNSEARIILASGYNAQEVARGFAGKNLAGFIQKPFQLEDLALALKRILGK
jgi:PAS domain S-box-containing protein